MIQGLIHRRHCRIGIMALAALAPVCTNAQALEIDARGVEASQAAVVRALDAHNFAAMQIGEPVTLRGLPVGDRRLDLELERFTVWTADAEFYINDRLAEKPDIVLLRGAVAGEDGSRVILGLGRHATNGFIETGGKVFSVSTGDRDGEAAAAEDIRIADLAGFAFDESIHRCAIDDNNAEAFAPFGVPIPPAPGRQLADRGEPPCRVARVAIDSDWEWTAERFGGNAQAAAEYALFLTAAISEIYQRDVNVRLVVPYLRTFSNNSDPYNGTTTPDPLDQVSNYWAANMGSVDRETVHLLTGANTSYGGVAYLSSLCDKNFGYGVSAYMDGSFPYPLQMNSYNNWDLVVMAHELGHNFGTLHTHDGYDPPIDRCGIDCAGSHDGTIMSYCHICSGGLINIDLRFHPLVQQVIEDFMANSAPCDLTTEYAANDDGITTIELDEPIDLFVLTNDSGPECDPVGIASVQTPTPKGATVTIQGWDNPTGNPTGHFLRYTPGPAFIGDDTFTYTTSIGQTADVTISRVVPRPPVNVEDTEPGVVVSYYDTGPRFTMPDFSTLEPMEQSVIYSLNFPETDGDAIGGPLSDFAGAVIEGFLLAPETGIYSLELESNDGSLLYLGDDLIIDNDGQHDMQTVSADVALMQGQHPLRIEFFENNGAAGLIFRWTGPGGSGVVPFTALSHESLACGPADIAEPFGILDLTDINQFILGFQIQWPATDITEPFGVWDLSDLSAFIVSFVSGCE